MFARALSHRGAGRAALVYLGGMRAVRSLGRVASTVCISASAAFVWSVLAHERVSLAVPAAIYAVGMLLPLGCRLWMLHSILLTQDGGWLLLPLLGRPKPMAPIADVSEQGDDLVVIGIDGRKTVLGVDRFPFRDRASVRHSLAETLRRTMAVPFYAGASRYS